VKTLSIADLSSRRHSIREWDETAGERFSVRQKASVENGLLYDAQALKSLIVQVLHPDMVLLPFMPALNGNSG
jgi:hypothetical protein